MYRQVIIVRRDLNMGKGKIAAQACHASLKVFLDRAESSDSGMTIALTDDMRQWLAGPFKKVVVYVESEAELLEIYRKANDAHLPCSLIQDAGHTVFHGVPTYTTAAVGPAKKEDLEPITGMLKLL